MDDNLHAKVVKAINTAGSDSDRAWAVLAAIQHHNLAHRPAQSAGLEEVAREIADKIDQQASCLEKYAEGDGRPATPVPSIYHFQASHFRDLANDLRALSPNEETGDE